MDKYVFLKVLENQEQVMIDPEYVLLIFTLCHIKISNQNTGELLYNRAIAPNLPIVRSCCAFVALSVLAIIFSMTWCEGKFK